MANVSFTGRLSKDAELRFTPDGKAVANLNVAENHSRKNKQTGQWEDAGTTWRRVAVFGKRAEALGELSKGTVVAVVGREETREFTTKDGGKGSSLEVTADVVGVVPTGQQQCYQNSQGQTVEQMQANAANQNRSADPWGQQGGQYDWGQPADQQGDNTSPF